MDLLRQRAGLHITGGRGRRRREGEGDDLERAFRERDERESEAASGSGSVSTSAGPSANALAGPSTITTASGHINLFEDLERVRHWLPLLFKFMCVCGLLD